MFRQNQDMIRSNYICKSYDKSDKCEFEKQEINKEAKTDFSSESQIIKTEKSRIIVEKESKVNSETDKISQETIKENFPFPTFLKDQLEILTEIVDAIEDGYKYIILESGVGKSAIAATLANIYESSFILSDNKKLQEKYHEEYDLINNDKFHVSNHSDAFNEFEKLDKRKLLIVDDAHKFDENIADFFSYKIRLSAFDDELIDSFYCDVRNKEKKEIDVGLDFINHLSLDDEMVNLIKYNIEENPDDWIWFYDKYYGGMIIFKPLNLENILKKYLLNKAEICIFMSSTILNKEIFANELGLNISEVKFIHKDFPFSSDANQIYLRNSANMHWMYSQNVDLVIPFIEDILEKHKNEKGIIHTDKPRYTSCIENQINNPRLIFHMDDDDLKEFKNSSNSVLVSEDRVEGMDFPKDSCRFQIILRQHLLQKDKRADYKDNESNWYSYKKAIYLVQLLQRVARSEDDGCITYILDERILTTIRKDIMDYHFIPDYILDSIEDMDVGGCELISDNVKKQLGVYYLFDYYSKNKKEDELSNKVLHYKSYGADKTDYTGQIDCSGGVINFGSDGQMLRKLCPDDDFDYFNNELMKAISVLSNQVIPNNISKLALVSVPSSTVERDAGATMRKSIKCIENWYDEGKTKTEACKKINTDLNEVKRWCNWNESGLFIDFKENNKKITAKLIIDAIKDGKSKDKIAENTDITVNELNKIIDLGSQNDRIYREVYEEYESVYLSKHLEVFLKEIKNKNLKKALKTSGIEKSELDSAYNSGKNGDERFTKFYNDYLNFKISCYITQIIRGKTVSKALKNSNLTDEELKDNLKEIESRILDKQMNSVIGEIAKNRTTRQAAKKARIRIDEIYRWYLEGKKGNEKFKDFADIYHELYVEVGCEIFQNFLNKGKTPKQILKIMNEDITREDYEFWIKNNLISDKNVEAKLYTEDEIKEKIENEGFRQKEEKSLSGLSIIGC